MKLLKGQKSKEVQTEAIHKYSCFKILWMCVGSLIWVSKATHLLGKNLSKMDKLCGRDWIRDWRIISGYRGMGE